MRTLYFDCFAGVSGNMILGALFDVGVDEAAFRDEIEKLGLSGYEIAITTVDRSGIASKHVNVRVPEEKAHRHLHHIEKIISDSSLAESVKERSTEIFRNLAAAEAKVHGTSIEKVHFHEVGAMDAIIDIVGACIGFEMLGIESFAASSIHVGSGFVEMEHGKFPVPPPAVAELLSGVPMYSTDIIGELATPTGVAIITTLATSYGQIPEMAVELSGYGAGTREYDGFPNVLRLFVGETSSRHNVETLTLLETNIDDSSPQDLGFLMERAFDAGALDCWFTPIIMKKARPAVTVSVMCMPADKEDLKDILYSESRTLGIRISTVERDALARENTQVETEYGTISVKVARRNGKICNAMPEYEDLRAAALRTGTPLGEVREAAIRAFESTN